METEVNDYQHQITAIIKHHSDEDGFPDSQSYGFNLQQFDDYLFEKQAILDSEGELKTQYTVLGGIIIAPVIIFSLFPQNEMPGGSNAIFVALFIGIVLAAIYKMIRKVMIKTKMKNVYDDDKERFINDITSYDERCRNSSL